MSQTSPLRAHRCKNGIINLDGTTVSFGENSVLDGDSASMKTIKASDIETENGLCSELYDLTLSEAYTELVTVTLPVPEEYAGAAKEALLVGFGVECEYDSGNVRTEYLYFPAEVADGAGSDWIDEATASYYEASAGSRRCWPPCKGLRPK